MEPAEAGLARAGNVLKLHGIVNFRTVTGLYNAFKNELSADVNRLDCSGVSECDSAAISLLLACIRLGETQNSRIQVEGMNEQLVSLARLYEVDNLLQIGAES
jgi:ABC-type transporter Mla MlaB component